MDEFSRRAVLGSIPAVAAAGCTTDGPGSNESSNGPTDAPSDSSDGELSYPDGWSEDGFSDVATVLETHADAMGSRSFTFSFESVAADGTYDQANEMLVRVQPDAEAVYGERETIYNRNDEAERRVKHTYRYVSGGEAYEKIEDTDRENGYEAPNSTFAGERRRLDDELLGYATLFEFSLGNAERDRDPTLLRYSSDGVTEAGREQLGDEWDDAISAAAASTLGVETTGAVLELGVELGVVDETEYFIDSSMTITDRGTTTVEEPEWLPEARSETGG